MLARLGPARQTDTDVQIPPGAVKLALLTGMERTVIGLQQQIAWSRVTTPSELDGRALSVLCSNRNTLHRVVDE